MLTTLLLAIPFCPPALEAGFQEPRNLSVSRLFEESRSPSPIHCPPVRLGGHAPFQLNGIGNGEDAWLRLGYESEFLSRESAPFLYEDYWWELKNIFEWENWELEERLFAVAPRAIPLKYRLTLEEDGESWVVLEGSEPVRPGHVVIFGDHRARMAVVDFDVEIAQATFIADPVSAYLVTGASLALELQPLPSGDLLVQAVARHSEEGRDEEIDLGYTAMEGTRRNTVHYEEAGTVFRMRMGEPIALQLPGLNGRKFTLNLEAAAGAPAMEVRDFLYLPSLARAPLGFRGPRPLGVNPLWDEGDYAESLPAPRDFSLDDYLESIEGWDGLFGLTDGGLAVFHGEQAMRVREAMKKKAEEMAESRVLAFSMFLHQEGETRELAAFEAPVVVGLPTGFSTGRIRQAVTDWDVEVAQGARVADPVFSLIEEGVSGTLRLVLGGNNRPMELELDLQVVEFHGFGRHALRLDHALESTTTRDGKIPGQPEDRVNVEVPKLSNIQISGRYPLAKDNGGYLLNIQRSARTLFGQGARIEVRVRVR